MCDGYEVGDVELIEHVGDHVERHVGPIAQVWHEIESPDGLHIDVYQINPDDERDFYVFVTCGMSARAMTVPPESAGFEYAELAVLLPPSWPVSKEAFQDEANFWPIRLLKGLARYPHESDTWLGWGHTVVHETNPPTPYASSTKQCAVTTLPPLSLPDEFRQLQDDAGRVTWFWGCVPIYREELELELNEGTNALLDKFNQHAISDVVEPDRPNAAEG